MEPSESEALKYDVVVVGAGLMGSAAAFYLSKRGKKVLLLEQFEFNHSKGSSFGDTRVIRREYLDPPLSLMIDKSYELWDAAQREAKEKVIHTTGSVDIAEEKDHPDLAKTLKIIRKLGLKHEMLTGAELKKRWPVFEGIPDSYAAVYQPHSGLGEPSASVLMFQKLAKDHGAELLDNQEVTDITLEKEGTLKRLQTRSGRSFTALSVVIATGPYSSDSHLLGKLGLGAEYSVWKMSSSYYKPSSTKTAEGFKSMPWFLLFKSPMCYGTGLIDNDRHSGHVKIGPFWSDEQNQHDHATRSFKAHTETISKLDDQAKNIFGQALTTPRTKTWTCLQSQSPDGNFVIDQPAPGISVCCSMSGHGFKFTPVIGHLLAQLALGEKPDFDLSPFKLKRTGSDGGHLFAELFGKKEGGISSNSDATSAKVNPTK